MYLEFETAQLIDNDFPNNKSHDPQARWFTRSQVCLMFTEGSKWPEKFELNLSFSSSREEQQSISAIAVGSYELSESAFGFDNRRNPIVDFTKLKPLAVQSDLVQAAIDPDPEKSGSSFMKTSTAKK